MIQYLLNLVNVHTARLKIEISMKEIGFELVETGDKYYLLIPLYNKWYNATMMKSTGVLSGEEYEPWTTNDPDYCSDYDNALPILYPLIAKAGQANAESNSTIIVNFISCVESGKLQLLEEKKESDFDIFKKDGINDFAPYEQTNALVDEISNLQLVHLPSGGVTVKQVLNKIDKDRYSSLAYALWWIMTYDNKLIQDNTDLLTSIARMNCISNGGNNSLQKLFM